MHHLLADHWCRDREDDFALPPARGADEEETPMGRLSREWQQQGQLAPPGSAPQQGGPGEYQYGSPEADQAAARLMQLGVTVNPPGNKETITWDRLAGGGSLPRPSCRTAPHIRCALVLAEAGAGCVLSRPMFCMARGCLMWPLASLCPSAMHRGCPYAPDSQGVRGMMPVRQGLQRAECILTTGGIGVRGRV